MLPLSAARGIPAVCSRNDIVGVRWSRWLAIVAYVSWVGIAGALSQDLIDKAIGLDAAVQPAREPPVSPPSPQVPLPSGIIHRPKSFPNVEVIPGIEEAWDDYQKKCEVITDEIVKVLDKRVRDAKNPQEAKSAQADVAEWIARKVLPEIPQCQKWNEDFHKASLALVNRYRDLEKKAFRRRPDLAIRLSEERIAVFKPWMKEFKPAGEWLFFKNPVAPLGRSQPEWRTIGDPGPALREGHGEDSKKNKFRWRLEDEHLIVTWAPGGNAGRERLEIVGPHEAQETAATGMIQKDGAKWVRLTGEDDWPNTPGQWISPDQINKKRRIWLVREGFVFENQDLQAGWRWRWVQRPQQNLGNAPVEFELSVPEKDVNDKPVLDPNGAPKIRVETYVVTDEDQCRLKVGDGLSSYVGGFRPGKEPK